MCLEFAHHTTPKHTQNHTAPKPALKFPGAAPKKSAPVVAAKPAAAAAAPKKEEKAGGGLFGGLFGGSGNSGASAGAAAKAPAAAAPKKPVVSGSPSRLNEKELQDLKAQIRQEQQQALKALRKQ